MRSKKGRVPGCIHRFGQLLFVGEYAGTRSEQNGERKWFGELMTANGPAQSIVSFGKWFCSYSGPENGVKMS